MWLTECIVCVVAAAGKVTEKVGEVFQEHGAVGKQFTPEGSAGECGPEPDSGSEPNAAERRVGLYICDHAHLLRSSCHCAACI